MSISNTISRAWDLARLSGNLLKLRLTNDETTRDEVLHALALRMASLRGIPQKVGQILSLRASSDSTDSLHAFDFLTDAGSAVPVEEFTKWLVSGLGPERFSRFVSIDPTGYAASIGQVHRALLDDGRMVAVKVQYPTIQEGLGADLEILGILTAPLRGKVNRKDLIDFDMKEYRTELGASLLKEIDYVRERETLSRAALHALEVPGVIVPKPIEELCSQNVLTMEWVDGGGFSDLLELSAEQRTDAALKLLRYFLRSWLVWGELHADPHPGNYRFQIAESSVSVGILDFGCIKTFSREEIQASSRLLLYAGSISPTEALETLVSLGFHRQLLTPLAEKLPTLIALVFKPFLTDGPFDTSKWDLSAESTRILGDDRWNFRLAGPAQLTFFIRAFSGLISQIDALGAKLNWRQELNTILGTSVPATSFRVGSVGPAPKHPACHLCILVKEGNETKVRLALPPHTVENLTDLIPEDVLNKLISEKVDVQEIGKNAIASGLHPQTLFELRDGTKTVSVSLK